MTRASGHNCTILNMKEILKERKAKKDTLTVIKEDLRTSLMEDGSSLKAGFRATTQQKNNSNHPCNFHAPSAPLIAGMIGSGLFK